MKAFRSLLLGLLLIIILIAIPTGYEDAVIYQESDRCVAKVLETDESTVISNGLIQNGEQRCSLLILTGKFKGQTTSGVNYLSGSLEQDKIYAVGDKALVLVSYRNSQIQSVTMSDHLRLDKEGILALCFVAFLIFFAGKKGFYAVFSFIISVLAIWKLLIPSYLKGANPILVGLLVTIFLTMVIMYFVYGVDRKFLCATGGAVLGILTTCILGVIFTDSFHIHGAVMPYSESLLYNGFKDLNLTAIFTSSIFIGASGAMMDLAVDITSAVAEVVDKKPDISWREAAKSGMNIGRAAMGTMTTTLLLAYSGSCVALLMVFMAQGTPVSHILNYKYVGSEILDTIVGSFGLVTVAPFTAVVSGVLLTTLQKEKQPI